MRVWLAFAIVSVVSAGVAGAGLAVAGPARWGKPKVIGREIRIPAGCWPRGAESEHGSEVRVLGRADLACKLSPDLDWKHQRIVEITRNEVNQSIVSVRALRRGQKVVIEVTVESICRGAALLEHDARWIAIPAGRAPVTVEEVAAPTADTGPCLAP